MEREERGVGGGGRDDEGNFPADFLLVPPPVVATAGDANDEEGEGVIEVEAIPRKKKVPAPVHCGVDQYHGGEKIANAFNK